jgi:hypothetical protein
MTTPQYEQLTQVLLHLGQVKLFQRLPEGGFPQELLEGGFREK